MVYFGDTSVRQLLQFNRQYGSTDWWSGRSQSALHRRSYTSSEDSVRKKIKIIWITFGNSFKKRLETEFQCQSYSLLPFSEEDQTRFLVKFWKERYSETENDYLDNLAKRVVKLSTEQLNVEDRKFFGIPLLSFY
jgi:hypothetical protein